MIIKTPLSEICSMSDVCSFNMPITQTEAISKAYQETFVPAIKNTSQKKGVCLFLIDYQVDFMENIGSMGIEGTKKDVQKLIQFMYENAPMIDRIAYSVDSHKIASVFFPMRFNNEKGEHPKPGTIIKTEDILNKVWIPTFSYKKTLEYVRKLELLGRRPLMIWDYHCIMNSRGQSIEYQLSNMIDFISTAKKSEPYRIIKGTNIHYEMYGILWPEIGSVADASKPTTSLVANDEFDKIIFAGEAKSHCFLESMKQLVEYFTDIGEEDILKKFVVLEDVSSVVNPPMFEESTEKEFEELNEKILVTTTDKYSL